MVSQVVQKIAVLTTSVKQSSIKDDSSLNGEVQENSTLSIRSRNIFNMVI